MSLNIKEVLSEAADFYKSNFKSLVSLSLCYVLVLGPIVMLVNFTEYIPTTVTDGSAAIFVVVTFIWAILLIIFGPRFFLATMVLIHSLMNGEQVNLKMAYKQTKGKYWAIAGRILLLGVFVFGVQAFFSSLLGLGFNNYFSFLFAAVINSLFYLIHPLVALEANTKHALKRSHGMIAGNYISVFTLYFLTSTLLNLLDHAIRDVLSTYLGVLIVTGIAYWVVMFFLFPFRETVCVVVYRKLKVVVEEPTEVEKVASDEISLSDVQ